MYLICNVIHLAEQTTFNTHTDHATPANARVQRNYKKLQIRKEDTDYIKTAKMGGHSGNLLSQL